MPIIRVEVSFKGSVLKGKIKRYDGQYVRKFCLNDIDTDCMSWIDLNHLLRENDVRDVARLWYKFPDINKIYVLGSDSEWLTLVDKLKGRSVVEIFVEHKTLTEDEEIEMRRLIKSVLLPSPGLDECIASIPINLLPPVGHLSTDSDESDEDFILPADESVESSVFMDEENDSGEDWTAITDQISKSATDEASMRMDVDVSDEEQLFSPAESDEDDGRKRKPFRMCSDEAESNSHVTMKLGDGFPSVDHFRATLINYSVQEGFSFTYKHNEKRRVVVYCKNKCGWYMRASPCSETGSFRIKSIRDTHSCGRTYENKRVDSNWISKKILPIIKGDLEWDPNGIRAYVRTHFHIEVSMQQCYRGKRKALKIIQGESSQQYKKIRDYCEAIMTWSPGSQARVSADNFIFQRLYVCLDACKRGFIEACRPLIAVDGCHLKSVYGGQLLCAVGKDANNNMYPIAFAVVEIENESSWRWFFECLKNDIGYGVEESWTFISDQQKGLVNSLNSVFPSESHRFCLRHLYGNFKSRFKGRELKDLLWRAAQSTRERDFEINMNLIRSIDNEAYVWLRQKNPQQWSRHAFNPRVKSDCLLSNVAECFNHWIGDARDKPILTLCETIRRMLMKRFVTMRDQYKDYQGGICPRIQKILERAKSFTKDYRVYHDGQHGHEVEHCFGGRYCVNLESKSCACRKWELTGIPCAHACAAILFHMHKPEDHVHPFYSIETFKSCYEHVIPAMPGPESWPSSNLPDLQAPVPRSLSGRPRKVRRREADEPVNPFVLRRSRQMKKCGSCGATGHNSVTCKNSVSNPARAAKMQKEAERQHLIRLKARERNERVSSPTARPKRSTARPSSQPVPVQETLSQSASVQPGSSSQPVRNSGVHGDMGEGSLVERTPVIRAASHLGGTLSTTCNSSKK